MPEDGGGTVCEPACGPDPKLSGRARADDLLGALARRGHRHQNADLSDLHRCFTSPVAAAGPMEAADLRPAPGDPRIRIAKTGSFGLGITATYQEIGIRHSD